MRTDMKLHSTTGLLPCTGKHVLHGACCAGLTCNRHSPGTIFIGIGWIGGSHRIFQLMCTHPLLLCIMTHAFYVSVIEWGESGKSRCYCCWCCYCYVHYKNRK